MQWITRERPKIDHIACPWLIRRFIESEAEFLSGATVVAAFRFKAGMISMRLACTTAEVALHSARTV